MDNNTPIHTHTFSLKGGHPWDRQVCVRVFRDGVVFLRAHVRILGLATMVSHEGWMLKKTPDSRWTWEIQPHAGVLLQLEADTTLRHILHQVALRETPAPVEEPTFVEPTEAEDLQENAEWFI